MKPPSRKRVRPDRFLHRESAQKRRNKKKLICSSWKRSEQRNLLVGLRRQIRTVGGTGEINVAELKQMIPKRSVQEVENMVQALKSHVVNVVVQNHGRQRREERKAKVPIEVWSELAGDMVGSLEEPISFAFSQMLIICSTEPRSLRNSDPPREATRVGVPDGRTVPLRPMPLPRPPQGPAAGRPSRCPTPSPSALPGVTRAPATAATSDPPPLPTSATISDGAPSATTVTNQGPSAASAAASVPSNLATATAATGVTSGRPLSAPSSSGTDTPNVSMSASSTRPVSSPPGGATAAQASPCVLAKHCPSPASTTTSSTTSLSSTSTSSRSPSTTSSATLSTTTVSSSSSATTSSTTSLSSTSTSSRSPSTTSSASLSTTTVSSSSYASLSTTTVSSSSSASLSTTTVSSSSSSATSSFQNTGSGPSSRFAQEDSPRVMGVRCIVDFEKIYRYLSAAHRPEPRGAEDPLTSMESAVLLDLLLSLPEELQLLDCAELERHMFQVYNRLTSPAVPIRVGRKMADHRRGAQERQGGRGATTPREAAAGAEPPGQNGGGGGDKTDSTNRRTAAAAASISVAMDGAGSQRAGTEPDGHTRSQSALKDNPSSQSGSSSQGTLDWEKSAVCPLNPFMVPMQLLARRRRAQ